MLSITGGRRADRRRLLPEAGARHRAHRFVAVALALAAAACSSSSTGPPHAPGSPTASPTLSKAPASVAGPQAPSPPSERIEVRLSHAPWTRAIDAAVGRANVAVAVGSGTRIRYLHLGEEPRIPASTQKLVTTMVALDTWGPSFRFPTRALARRQPTGGVIRGDLFIVGSGDPRIDPGAMSRLAGMVRSAGVRRVDGAVVGDTGAFTREWWAPGWVPGLSRSFVNRTTALAFEGNAGALPELAAARSLSASLEDLGVVVAGEPDAREAPASAAEVARIGSAPLATLLATQNHDSVNFYAETMLKALGAEATNGVGSTEAGAAAVERWAADRGERVRVRDGSGLSYEDRISARSLVSLLLLARRAPWGDTLASSLPGPGEGTLGQRLTGLPVHAKTGTLFEVPVSSLAGYLTDASGSVVAFSLISRGVDKISATTIEDEVVRVIAGSRVG